ncbi:MAG TPA: hypothetical protein PK280_20115, partial [Planctomycetota bacterium]|nr:hypothetical protein [Planctomycetota bacterium]
MSEGMREAELRKYCKCSICGKKIGEAGMLLFWRVRIERFGVDLGAVQRQDGLAAMLNGHAALARVMGPDEEMAKAVMEPVTLAVCET